MDSFDAIVIGSGPNGLVAAIDLARKGWDVLVLEQAEAPGGAVRSEASTVPGYVHDTFSAFYGLLHSTSVFADYDLGTRVRWASFDTPVGALTDPRAGAYIQRNVEDTASGLAALDPRDGEAWLEWHRWWRKLGERFFRLTLAPVGSIRPALRFARATGIRRAIPTAQTMVEPLEELMKREFSTEAARVLFASGISHTDLSVAATASVPQAVILAMLAQDYNMPIPVGGAGKLTDALVGLLGEHRGKIRVGDAVTRVLVDRKRAFGVETAAGYQARARHAVLADTGPGALFHQLVGDEHLPAGFLDGLRRARYGTGMFKVDIALSGAPRWLEPRAGGCGVVHLTGTLDDMARAAFEASRGMLPREPMLIVGQQTIADATRAPIGGHTLWVETHVPPTPHADASSDKTFSGWGDAREPFLDRVLARLEAHAPGLREQIVGIAVHTPDDLQRRDPNLVGGDVGGGSNALDQQLVFRPVPGWFRYRTPIKGLYLCSASAHPGGGVHGMSGRNAARRALKDSRTPSGLVTAATSARRSPRRS